MREIVLAAAGVASITASAVLWAGSGQSGAPAPNAAGISVYELHLARPAETIPEQPILDSI